MAKREIAKVQRGLRKEIQKLSSAVSDFYTEYNCAFKGSAVVIYLMVFVPFAMDDTSRQPLRIKDFSRTHGDFQMVNKSVGINPFKNLEHFFKISSLKRSSTTSQITFKWDPLLLGKSRL